MVARKNPQISGLSTATDYLTPEKSPEVPKDSPGQTSLRSGLQGPS